VTGRRNRKEACGGLRTVVKVMNWAGVLAQGREVGREHVAAAWRDLGGG